MNGLLVFFLSFFFFCQLERNTLKGGRTYFGSQFQKLQPLVDWLCCFWVYSEAKHQAERGAW
jgi:hypothetical protein